MPTRRDNLGTARSETSSAQAVIFSLIPDAFGNTVATTGSTGSSYGFAATSGYRTDGDAGLMKVGCRYYDPQVGSFTTRDTYLDQKPYLYCEHDPVNGVDPTGHDWDWIDDVCTVIAFVGGIAIKGPAGVAFGGAVGARPAYHAARRLWVWLWTDDEKERIRNQNLYWKAHPKAHAELVKELAVPNYSR